MSDSHKHVTPRLGPKTYMMIIDLVLNSKHSTTSCYKAELTMDDLMTTKTQGHCSRKPSGLSYLSQISD